jgi:hypothetical protein
MRPCTKKNATKDDEDVYWLMKDFQFVLRLCLLSELGFELSVVKPTFCIDNMVETRRARKYSDINLARITNFKSRDFPLCHLWVKS